MIVYTMMKKIIRYMKLHKVVTGIVVVVLAGGGYFVYSKLNPKVTEPTYVLGKVQRGDLVVSVSGSGQVATLSKVEIKPQTTGQSQTLGQILKVNVVNGQTVKAGDVIAVLDGKSALQSYNQAKATVASAQASYDKLVNGATDSDLQSSVSSVQSAQVSLANAAQNINTGVQSAYITASNLVFVSTDPFFDNVLSATPTINITDVNFTNQQLQFKVNAERAKITETLAAWRSELNSSTSTDPVNLVNSSIAKLTEMRTYFDDMATLLTLYSSGASSAGISSIETNKSTASGARSTINSSITTLTSSLQSYQNAVLSLQQSRTSLDFKKAPANPSDIAVAKAQLDNAKANLANAYETYASRIITAPFDGQIGGLTAQVGQQITSSDVLGTIITPQKVVNISLNEVDAAKVKAGDSVEITFDALPSVKIVGSVSYLDPLGVVSQGVVNYAVQIKMDTQDAQIKTGMTASAEIITSTKAGVLMVPTSAISKIGDRTFVMVPSDAMATSTAFASSTRQRNLTNRTSIAAPVKTEVRAVPVTVGISNDTSTEIIDGLIEGQTIVTRTIAAGSAGAATTARTGSVFGVGGGSSVRAITR